MRTTQIVGIEVAKAVLDVAGGKSVEHREGDVFQVLIDTGVVHDWPPVVHALAPRCDAGSRSTAATPVASIESCSASWPTRESVSQTACSHNTM
jgi:hypothetical protein